MAFTYNIKPKIFDNKKEEFEKKLSDLHNYLMHKFSKGNKEVLFVEIMNYDLFKELQENLKAMGIIATIIYHVNAGYLRVAITKVPPEYGTSEGVDVRLTIGDTIDVSR